MSGETTVMVTRTDDGRYTAVDAETGAFGEGNSKVDALADLLELLQALQKIEEASSRLGADAESPVEDRFRVRSDDDPQEAYERLSTRVQQRVREENVDKDVLEDAIEWARRQ